jgi:hypothetical protein
MWVQVRTIVSGLGILDIYFITSFPSAHYGTYFHFAHRLQVIQFHNLPFIFIKSVTQFILKLLTQIMYRSVYLNCLFKSRL